MPRTKRRWAKNVDEIDRRGRAGRGMIGRIKKEEMEEELYTHAAL